MEGAIGSFDPRDRCLPDLQSRDAHRGRNPDRLHEVAVWNFEMRHGCHASFSDVRRSWEVDVTKQNREFLTAVSSHEVIC